MTILSLHIFFQTKNQIYITRYYVEASNQWRGLSPRLSVWATQKRHNCGKPLTTMSDLTVPETEPSTSRTESEIFRVHEAQLVSTILFFQIEPVVQPGNENNVHHILLYQCSEDVMVCLFSFNVKKCLSKRYDVVKTQKSVFTFILISRKSDGDAIHRKNSGSLKSCLCFRIFR